MGINNSTDVPVTFDAASPESEDGGEYNIYVYPDGRDSVPMGREQAIAAGFCPGCGWFVAGNEWDDLHINSFGLCGECVEEYESEMAEHVDDE